MVIIDPCIEIFCLFGGWADESFLLFLLVNIRFVSIFSKLSVSLGTKVRQYLNLGGAFYWSKFKVSSRLIGVLHDGCVLHDWPLFSWAGVAHKLLLLLRVSECDSVENVSFLQDFSPCGDGVSVTDEIKAELRRQLSTSEVLTKVV